MPELTSAQSAAIEAYEARRQASIDAAFAPKPAAAKPTADGIMIAGVPSNLETSKRATAKPTAAADTTKPRAAQSAAPTQQQKPTSPQEEQNKRLREQQAKARKVNDDLRVNRFNRVEPHTQETILKRDPNLQRLATEGRITPPASQTKNNQTPKAGFPTPSAEPQPPGLERVVNQDNRTEIVGQESKTQVFDINSFRSEIINNDVLPSHSYLVTFSPFRLGFPENGPLTDFVTNKKNTLVMRCESVILPTPSLLEEENIRRYGYGPVEKIPYGVQFSDVSMTWLVDNKAEIIDFMHQWMNTIVMHDSPNASMSKSYDPENTRDGVFYSYNPFEVGYKDGYANPIVRIYVYNRKNQTVTEYEMYDVFPMNIQSMNLGWADENQVQKLTVNFAYTNMKVRAPQKTTAPQMNYVMEMIANSNEERKQPSNKGGKAAADKATSPVGEITVTSVNAGNPFSYESTPQTLNLGVEATPILTTHELTSI